MPGAGLASLVLAQDLPGGGQSEFPAKVANVVCDNYLLLFPRLSPPCRIVRRRHSAAMTFPHALPDDETHRDFVQLIYDTPHKDHQAARRRVNAAHQGD